MTAVTRFVLDHKRLVVGFWIVVTIAAFAAIQPSSNALSQEFSVPGREGFETNKELAELYGSGGNVAPIVPVVKLPKGKTVDSPGVMGSATRRSEGREALRGHTAPTPQRATGVRLRRR